MPVWKRFALTRVGKVRLVRDFGPTNLGKVSGKAWKPFYTLPMPVSVVLGDFTVGSFFMVFRPQKP